MNEQNTVLRLDFILQFVISEAVGGRIFSERFKYNSNLSDKRSLRLFYKIQPKHLVQEKQDGEHKVSIKSRIITDNFL